MDAAKFAKQKSKPNPLEVDYWVDLSEDPRGSNIKYFNGYNWVTLTNKGNSTINLNGYYDKASIDKMMQNVLSDETIEATYQKKLIPGENVTIDEDNVINVDVDSVVSESTSILDKKIDMETLRAIAVETRIENRVDQHYSETDSFLELKADKSDTYTKQQIDSKLSGVYKIKGSIQYENLPITGNVYGDVYNITNDFVLYDTTYPAGTNIVFTEYGWDVLSGVFDTTSLEESIQTVSDGLSRETLRAIEAETYNSNRIIGLINDTTELATKLNTLTGNVYTKAEINGITSNYLPLSGGNMTGTIFMNNNYLHWNPNIYSWDDVPTGLVGMNTSNNDYGGYYGGISYRHYYGLQLRVYGGDLTNFAIRGHNGDEWGNWYRIYHTGNFKPSDYLPLSGGRITGSISSFFEINRTNGNPLISFYSRGTHVGFLGISESEKPMYVDTVGKSYYIWHSGNFNPSNYLPLSGGTITSANYAVLNIKRDTTSNVSIAINFLNNNGAVCDIMADPVTKNLKRGYNSTTYTIWDSGNDGANSGLDADLLDGRHSSGFAIYEGVVGANNSSRVASIGYTYATQEHGGLYAGGFISFGVNEYFCQLHGNISKSGLAYRFYNTEYGKFSDWKSIAFTDSNVASATKLQTARTIWGQSFDGTGNIAGDITLEIGTTSYNVGAKAYFGIAGRGKVASIQGLYTSVDWNASTNYAKGALVFSTYNSDTINTAMYIDHLGNIGIGTTNPSYRLHVEGDGYFNGSVSASGNILPSSSLTYNLGTSSVRWNFINAGAANLTSDNSWLLTLKSTSSATTIAFQNTTDNTWTASMYSNNNFQFIYNSASTKAIGFDTNGLITCNGYAMRGSSNDYVLLGGGSSKAIADLNVLSATKLANSRTIWGKSFDGTGNVDGDFTLNNNAQFYIKDNTNTHVAAITLNSNNLFALGWGVAGKGYSTLLAGNDVSINTGTSKAKALHINPSGGVTIGSSDLASTDYKLYVNGNTYISKNLVIKGGVTAETITQESQRDLKDIIDEKPLSLDDMSNINPTRFKWKDNRDDKVHYGGIAEDIQQVIPEVVHNYGDTLTVEYANAAFVMVTSLVKHVKELTQRISELEKECKQLRNAINL